MPNLDRPFLDMPGLASPREAQFSNAAPVMGAASTTKDDGMLLVKMSLQGHVEHFDTAVSWYATDDGGLILWPQDKSNHQPVAQFAPGAWLAVFEAQPKTSDGIHLAARRAPTDKAVRSA